MRQEPRKPGWWRDLAIVDIYDGRPRSALGALQRSFDLSPEARTLAYLAHAQAQLGCRADAVGTIAAIRGKWPASAPVECDLGRVYEILGDNVGAFASYRKSIRLEPKRLRSYERLADLAAKWRRNQVAYACRVKAAKIRNYDAPSLRYLAIAQFEAGYLRASLKTYRRLLALQPQSLSDRSNYLFALLHDEQNGTALREAHEEWFRTGLSTQTAPPGFANDRNLERRLRIGYLSGEFKFTPSYQFLTPLIRQHDRKQFEVTCYQLAARDQATWRYEQIADRWVDLHGQSAVAIRDRIRDDRIDILVDVSGQFPPHGLAVFQMRAAPIQVSYPNYPSTTGCRHIDYFIADLWTCPTGAEQDFSEGEVCRIPSGYLVYQPPDGSPEVTPLPALHRGYVTFGIFQRAPKLNAKLWGLVARILTEVPNSRLLVQHADSDLDLGGHRLARMLTSRGIHESRFSLAGNRSEKGHLEAIASVDIALDTFPYNGQTTTCNCLWMGVPTVSLAGESFVSRVSTSLLERVGLSDWTATSPDAYVTAARSKSCRLQELASLRTTLRTRLQASSIMKAELTSGEIDAAFRHMWVGWRRPQGSPPVS